MLGGGLLGSVTQLPERSLGHSAHVLLRLGEVCSQIDLPPVFEVTCGGPSLSVQKQGYEATQRVCRGGRL